MRILWFQLGEQDYVAVTPQDISASEQRFRTNTAEVWCAEVKLLCLRRRSGIEAERTITVSNLPDGDGKAEGSGRLSVLLPAVDPGLFCLPPHGHGCGPIHTRDCGSSIFLLGLERAGISCANDCHTLVEATLNFLFTHYVNFGNTPVNGSKYTH